MVSALHSAFADINIDKRWSVYYWLGGLVGSQEG
jgi:hypothetical protein